MTARDKFQELVRGYFKPALKARGFSARGTTFYRFDHGNWGLIQLQTHRLSSAEKLLFTVNICVASARLSSLPADRKSVV